MMLALLLAAIVCRPVVGNGIIGIDLGTEFMKVALVKPGTPLEIVTNHFSKRKTETAVAFVRGERFFGSDAYGQLSRKPELAVARLSSFLGQHDPEAALKLAAKSYTPLKVAFNESRESLGLTVGDAEMSVEELVAMMLSYAKEITKAYGGVVKDCVITVPSFATQAAREAMIRAADLAELRVLSLIDENTAAAVQFGLDRMYEEKRRVLFYNCGAENVQASLVEYSTFSEGKAKGNKTVGQLEVLGKGWAIGKGSFALDLVITELLAEEFEKKAKKGDRALRSVPRPMAKIRAAAKKVKEVLSANAQIPVHVPQVHEDRDLATTMTRKQLEDAGTAVFAELTRPIQAAVDMANLTMDDIDAVEIIGGGVRVPKVQQILSEFFGEKRSKEKPTLELGLHLNGDEAFALGAAFHGANVSTSFRVRKVGMVDTSPFSIGVELKSDAWQKNASLFKRGAAKYGGKAKTIAFQHDADLTCELLYEDESGGSITLYNITGIAQFAKDMAHVNATTAKPKVQLSFSLDASGITTISKAEVSILVNATTNATTNTSDDELGTKDLSRVNETALSPETTNDTNAILSSSSSNNFSTVNATVNATVSPALPKPKLHKRALRVETIRSGTRSWPAILSDAAAAKRRLSALQAAETRRIARQAAKNDLETAIYSVRGALAEAEEEGSITSVSTEAQRSSLADLCGTVSLWLDDEADDDVEVEVFEEKRQSLRSAWGAIKLRLEESRKRPSVVAAAKKALNIARDNATTVWPTSKPWLTTEELDDLLKKIDKAEVWLKEVEEKQLAADPTNDPVFLVADVAPKLKPVAGLAARLEAKPKPKPPKVDTNETNATLAANDTNTSNTTETTTKNDTDPATWDEL